MEAKKILITGMSGLIGGLAREKLQGKYELRALNRRPVEGVECHQADIADFKAMRPAFDGQDIVIHLAAIAHGDTSWEEILQHNVIGTYNVFEAAGQAGVKRVIFASSGATVSACEREFPYSAIASKDYDQVPESWDLFSHESPTRPAGLYGCSKVWGEALARRFSGTYGMSVICLRIGAVPAENKPLEPRQFSAWCSHEDIAQMIERCVDAPDDLQFDIFFVVSNNRYSYRDISHAKEILGYEPIRSAEEFQ